MTGSPVEPPRVSLSRLQWTRMIIVAALVLVALTPVVPDFVRVLYPISFFGYSTNGDGVVRTATRLQSGTDFRLPGFSFGHRVRSTAKATPAPQASATPRPSDRLLVGDRVRVDRIRPFDRKPGVVGRAFTYDSVDRYLPIERGGVEQVLYLHGRQESVPTRVTDMLRIVLLITAVSLGGLLFLLRPNITTAAFFVFCLGAVEAPATYFVSVVPMPWRQIPAVTNDVLHALVRPALLLFVLCLIDGDEDPQRERRFAWLAGTIGVGLAVLNAYAQWLPTFGAGAAERFDRAFVNATAVVSVVTGVALAAAFWRARPTERQRIAWIAGAFLFAGFCRYASDALFPAHIPLWFNGLLVSTAIVPIGVIWFGVVRYRILNVDFAVSRAVLYMAVSGAVLGAIAIADEVAGFIYYNSSVNVGYGVVILLGYAVGFCTWGLSSIVQRLSDRFIFIGRREQRLALEFIAGYIIDAETVDDVYRALLQDAAHALKLSFGGILARQPDGGYALAQHYGWPEGLVFRLGPNDEVTKAITRTRGALTFTGKDTRLIQKSFPNEQLAFAAPLFFDREVSGIVVYGHNVSGLDLDPEEREHLVRVVTHASIALNTIELARYRTAAIDAILGSANVPATGAG